LPHTWHSPSHILDEGTPMAQRIDKEDARQGKTLGVMRYVLGISFFGAILALALTWLFGSFA
jgi:hypothetical protein